MDQNPAERSEALNTRIQQVKTELDDVKRQLAALESLLCHCQPEREHSDYTRWADYMHAADCIVAAAQQTASSP